MQGKEVRKTKANQMKKNDIPLDSTDELQDFLHEEPQKPITFVGRFLRAWLPAFFDSASQTVHRFYGESESDLSEKERLHLLQMINDCSDLHKAPYLDLCEPESRKPLGIRVTNQQYSCSCKLSKKRIVWFENNGVWFERRYCEKCRLLHELFGERLETPPKNID